MTNEHEPNSYQERLARRRARLHRQASAAEAESERRYQKSRAIASLIPMGQPVMVGHHSERRHRADLRRIDTNMRKGYQAAKQAEQLRSAAARVGQGGISSDDPQALQKLERKLAAHQEAQEKMKAANKLVKRGDRAGLLALGFTEAQADKLLAGDFAGRKGFPAYALTNNNANIKRIEKRIAELKRNLAAQATAEELRGDGWRIYVEDNRVCVAFDQRQPERIARLLKSHGFNWSPTRGAWVRKYSEQALHWAKHIVGIQ